MVNPKTQVRFNLISVLLIKTIVIAENPPDTFAETNAEIIEQTAAFFR